MKIVIAHKKTKREIDGAFNICLSRHNLESLVKVFKEYLNNDFVYGWINIDEVQDELKESSTSIPYDENQLIIKRQKNIPNSEPQEWD